MLIPDMFTGELSPPRDSMDMSAGFDSFWKAWPKGNRKVAKPQCLAKWIKLRCAESSDHIVAHVEWMKTQVEWLQGFSPMPQTYLNQERWSDWEPDTRPAYDPVAATKELLAERDRNYRPPSAEIKAKLAELRRASRDATPVLQMEKK